MIKNFFDEIETFKVNENFTWEVKEVGPLKAKVIVVDNFYKNPEMVRDLALTIPPSINQRIMANLPYGPNSGRISAFYLMDQLAPAYEKIYRESLPEIYKQMPPDAITTSFRDATFIVNVMTSENLPPRVPHVDFPDDRVYASLIFLNTPEECAGGTGFYTFNGSMKGFVNHMDSEKTIPPDHFIVDDTGGWKLIEMVEMKFNRMIMYPQSIYHNAYIKPGMFTGNNYRINQIFFI